MYLSLATNLEAASCVPPKLATCSGEAVLPKLRNWRNMERTPGEYMKRLQNLSATTFSTVGQVTEKLRQKVLYCSRKSTLSMLDSLVKVPACSNKIVTS